MESKMGRQGCMRRQRRSITDIICENCKYLPTKRSRNKSKPIPKESDVKTFDYVYGCCSPSGTA
ncbi:NinE family protein [Salmonella enterica subsp. enterica serovar Rubislaw]|nr:NinE family protein [Salmonella enterica subsp. enterica serovar Rubislaw]